MNSGIQDAANLAWKLAASLRGEDGEALLDSYENERRNAVQRNVERYTDALTRLILQSPLAVLHRVGDLLHLALRVPRLARLLAARVAMLDTRYPNSPCVLGKHALRGRRAAVQAELRAAGGALVKISDLVDPKAALLVFCSLPRAESERQALCTLEKVTAVPFTVYYVYRSEAEGRCLDHELTDRSGGLWASWKARDGLLVLIRPDGHIAWAADDPSLEEVRSVLLGSLGVRKKRMDEFSLTG